MQGDVDLVLAEGSIQTECRGERGGTGRGNTCRGKETYWGGGVNMWGGAESEGTGGGGGGGRGVGWWGERGGATGFRYSREKLPTHGGTN